MTTDGGGWNLIQNRLANSDDTGQPDINVANGAFDDTRATSCTARQRTRRTGPSATSTRSCWTLWAR